MTKFSIVFGLTIVRRNGRPFTEAALDAAIAEAATGALPAVFVLVFRFVEVFFGNGHAQGIV